MAEKNIKPLNGLYNKLRANGAQLPDEYTQFENAFTKPGKAGAENRHKLYNQMAKDGLADGDDYSTWYATYFQPISKNSSKAREAGTPMTITERNNMMAETAGMMYANKASADRANKRMARTKANTGLDTRTPKLGENRHVTEMETGGWDMDKAAPETTYVTESGNEYNQRAGADLEQNAIDEARMQNEQTETYLKQKQARLTEDLDKRAEEIDKKVDAEDGSNWFTNIIKELATGGNPQKIRDVREGKYNLARSQDTQYTSLKASLAQVDEALDTIKEGKKGKASDEWIEDSSNWFSKAGKNILAFGAGAGRGFLNTVGKVSTWDSGASDFANNAAIRQASDKAGDKGENMDELPEEQRDLLNLAALNQKVQADNEEYIGHGYKAGQVTGEMAPFMAEMALNPLSGTGKTAMKMVMKEAIKKYGKDAIRRNIGKYMAAKIGTRVLGDALGAVGMSLTTGLQKVAADAEQRMTGDIQYGYGDGGKVIFTGTKGKESAGRAYLKALTANSIENQSEMVSEYFSPFLKGAGKLLAKGLPKVTVERVGKFIDSVGSSDFAQMISNFESKAKWHGSLSEYCEEVVGNVENALLVGDQTLDTAKGTGVFNGEQNLDTFLGVTLLGGSISAAKTLGYRGAKRETANKIASMGKQIDKVFAGNIQAQNWWGGIRNTLMVGTAAEKRKALRSVLEDKKLPFSVRYSILQYSAQCQKFEGIVRSMRNRRGEDTVNDKQNDNYERGYAAKPQEMAAIKDAYTSAQEALCKAYDMPLEALGTLNMEAIEHAARSGKDAKAKQAALNYLTAKAAYTGMIEHIHDDIKDAQDYHEAMIDNRTDETGNIQQITLKEKDANGGNQQMYLTKGKVVMTDDGTMVNVQASDKSLTVVDGQGRAKLISPKDIFRVDAPVKAEEEKKNVLSGISQEKSQRYADIIDGVTDAEGNPIENSTNTENTESTESTENTESTESAPVMPKVGETVELTDAEGSKTPITVQAVNADGYEVTDGNRVWVMPADEMQKAVTPKVENTQANGAENTTETATDGTNTKTAMERIPTDEKTGEPMFEKADKSTALDALNEMTQGNEEASGAIVNAQVAQAQKALDELKKKQPTRKAAVLKGTPMEMLQAQQKAEADYKASMEQYNNMVAEAEEKAKAWASIAEEMNNRKQAAVAQQEAERKAEEEVIQKAAEEQKKAVVETRQPEPTENQTEQAENKTEQEQVARSKNESEQEQSETEQNAPTKMDAKTEETEEEPQSSSKGANEESGLNGRNSSNQEKTKKSARAERRETDTKEVSNETAQERKKEKTVVNTPTLKSWTLYRRKNGTLVSVIGSPEDGYTVRDYGDNERAANYNKKSYVDAEWEESAKSLAEDMRNEGWEIENKLSKQKNLLSFEVGDVVRDNYDTKLYRIKKHGKNGVSTLAELDEDGNEIAETSVNTANNVRYTLIEAAPKVNAAEKDEKSRKASEKGESNEKEGESKSTETTQKPTFLDVVSTLYNKGKEYASKIFSRSFFDVASTPDFMKEYGLTGSKFTIQYGVLARHFGKDTQHDLPLNIWKSLPEALRNPLYITKYFVDEEKKVQKGYRLYTSLRLDDGTFVMVSAEVVNAGRDIKINKINTVFGKGSISKVHDEIIYKNPKTTPEQEALLGGTNPHQYPTERELSGGKGKQKTETKQEKAEKNVDEPIEDVGEKIGGARKDLYAEMQSLAKENSQKSDEDLRSWIAKLPISKIFDFDLAKLRADGLSNEAATFIQFVKGYCPAKPRTDKWKLFRWLNKATQLYRLCLEAVVDFERIENKADETGNGSISDRFPGYAAMIAIGGYDSGLHLPKGTELKQCKEGESMWSRDKGLVSIAGKWAVTTNDAFSNLYVYDTYEEAVEALKKLAGENAVPKKKEIQFVVYGRKSDGTCFITPKGKSDAVIADGFKTSKEAFDYIKEHNAELQERYRTLMSDTNVKLGENRERKGRNWRDGKDVSAEIFRQTFGFRGVEFGNWMKQEDRRKALNECYDALMDLADVCGVSPQALSLDGKLGLAFGARGGGNANAHYEPEKNVINLTKTKGAGALAHEWFHAIDAYFARMGGAEAGKHATSLEGIEPKGLQVINTRNGKSYWSGTKRVKEAEYEAEAWKHLVKAIETSAYGKRSKSYASLHSNYWREPTEMGARAFSVWVENELSKRNATNDYLANNPALLEEALDDNGKRFAPYPFNTDAEWLDEAFGNLFNTMQEKVDEETGHHVLYHKAEGVKTPSKREVALRDALVDIMTKNGMDMHMVDDKEGQRVLDMANGKEVREQRVYHGSGADFDAFDHRHMGEGEGRQAYGWGTYVTEVEGIGRTYAEENSGAITHDDFEREQAQTDIAEKVLERYGGIDCELEVMYDGAGGFELFSIPRDETILAEFYEYFKEHEDEFDAYLEDIDLSDKYGREDFARSVERSMLDYATDVASEYDELWDVEEQRILYTVEIPDDNGKNYLDWNEKIPAETINRIAAQLKKQGWERRDYNKEGFIRFEKDGDMIDLYKKGNGTGKGLYEDLASVLTPQGASELLSEAGFDGIKYPADNMRGGRKDGAKNYVIFKEADARITDKVRFFRTANGEAYGFTVGGKIYIDPRIATSETPIHEYAHLWATALREGNPKEWANVVNLMKGTPIWDEVKERYPELKTDDDIADEVLAHYSGRRGAERLREEARKITGGNGGVFEKAEALSALQRVKRALADFWKGVADMLHIHYKSAEDVADRVMKDLLDGVDPREFAANNDIRSQFVGEKGAANADHAEEVTTRLDNLQVAREMEDAKKDAKTIKMATGWERGADGKWRYEIPDFKFVDNFEKKPFKRIDLYDIMDYESYKKIRDLYYQRNAPMPEVSIQRVHAVTNKEEEERKARVLAYVDEENSGKVTVNLILGGDYWNGNIADLSSTKVQSTLNHEMQHVIQLQEGFAQGGSILKSDYYNLAGEVEARNVQNRMGMTDEERRNSLAAETEDVSRKDQIFLFGVGGKSYMGTRTNKHMAEIGAHYEGKTLTDEEQAIIDVFSGKRDRPNVTFMGMDGKEHQMVMIQGQDEKAGSKHAIYRHYGEKQGWFKTDELPYILDVVKNGKEEQEIRGRTRLNVYQLEKDGVKYTVLTEMKKGKEIFNDFYTNRKASLFGTSNTSVEAHTSNNNALSAAKLSNSSETANVADEKKCRRRCR